jgi:hypothetical protein
MELKELLSKSLCLDLETTPEGKIFKIGGVFQDHNFEKQGRFNLKEALSESINSEPLLPTSLAITSLATICRYWKPLPLNYPC